MSGNHCDKGALRLHDYPDCDESVCKWVTHYILRAKKAHSLLPLICDYLVPLPLSVWHFSTALHLPDKSEPFCPLSCGECPVFLSLIASPSMLLMGAVHRDCVICDHSCDAHHPKIEATQIGTADQGSQNTSSDFPS